MNKKHYLFILLGLGLLTRFMFFGHPNQTVFDEVHFGKFVSAYYTHEFYFDIHPALGKLMIAGSAKLTGFKPEFAFAEIGQKFPNKQYVTLRFLPSLAGALLPLVIYLLLLELGITPFGAFIGGLFIVLENALLTQSHYILMDSFMLLFGFSSFLFYLKYHNTGNRYWLPLAGLTAGLGLSVKWLALSFIGLPLLFEGLNFLKQFKDQGFKYLKSSGLGLIIASLFILPLTIYFLVFAVDFSLLTKSGTGDAFMSPAFQKTLQGSKYEKDETVNPANLFQKFMELNAEMYKANQRLTATHPYSSQWYTWPFMIKPIYYWIDSTSTSPDSNSRIYLIGNPFIWWLSTIAVFYSLIVLLLTGRSITKNKTILILLTGYIVNMLPFIGVHRVMFLYHYFLAYIFGIMTLIYVLDQDRSLISKRSKIPLWILLVLGTMAFIYFAPLSYGLDLSSKSYEMHVWFDSWK